MESEKLDCGHPLDEGSPAQIREKSGELKTIQGWRFVKLDDGRKVCHACSMQVILDCGHNPSPHSNFTTGYATDADGKKSCYDCCAKADIKSMHETGKATLYLTNNSDYKEHLGNVNFTPKHYASNWPGSLQIPVYHVRSGRHNIAGKRYDAWFNFEDGFVWHGINIGDKTKILRCKRTKQKWRN